MIFSANSRYKSYICDKVVDLPELQARLIQLTHEPTGAQILHIECDDDENLFSLSFQTLPENSTGVAHILEHTVLCGSEHFPVKDPFFGMTRRSLNTFMNALTGADFTCYPASSLVPKDFYNLLLVYLDAVFKPRLLPLSFLQEGHRLEFAEPENPKSELLFKGVVFNEMKGAMATGEARLHEELLHELFPNLTYGYNSGGDPKVIPTLSYGELKSFYKRYYHPSRCLFFFYGNLPLEGHLDFLEERAFKGITKIPPLPILPPQPRFQKSVERSGAYPCTPEEAEGEKSLVGMGWLTCSILHQEELLALAIIDTVLMGTDASPLKMALLKSGLCKQAESYIDAEMSEAPLLLICKGCSEKSPEGLEKIVRDTLGQYAEKGLPHHLVEGAIHQLEFSRTEISGGSSPYGLTLFYRAALLRQHGGKPEEGLMIHTLFKHLREQVKDHHYLGSLIRKYLLDNTHFARLCLNPDPALAAKEMEAEKETLKKISESLTDAGVKAVIKQTKELSIYQESQEDNFDLLPKITLADVPKQGKEFALTQETIGSFTLFHHPCFTNEIIYANLVFDLPEIGEEELSLFPLFTFFLTQVGSGGRDYKGQLDYILEHIGGISAAADLCLQVDNPEKMRPMLFISGKAIHRKADKLFKLLKDLVQSADFTDRARLQELLEQHYHDLESSINHSPLRYAINLATAGLSSATYISNLWNGLNYFWKVKEVLASFEKEPHKLIEKMQAFQKRALSLTGGHLVLCCSEEMKKMVVEEKFFGLQDMETHSFSPWKAEFSPKPSASQGRFISSPVAFTVSAFPSIPYLHPDSAALSVAAGIMENKVLHKRVREQGGAYGSGAVHAPLLSQFYFYSYRDPHLSATLEAFAEGVKLISSGRFDDRDVEEAKLGLIQDIDGPIAPGKRAMAAYTRARCGRTAQQRQAFREKLLGASNEKIREAAKNYLLPHIDKATTVSFAAKELLEKENFLLKEKSLKLYTV